MPYSTTSIESVMLGHVGFQLTFANMELQKDPNAVIVKANVTNSGKNEEAISSQYFILASSLKEATPNVSYMSEPNKQGCLWTWKRLKPDETCTIILRYQLEPDASSYDFNYLYRQQAKLIKRFEFE